jgi:hypothetical protein|tara:strand:- start:549 stop:1193 length:645 start_codon:yes stop_codon:yes gene_type:complete
MICNHGAPINGYSGLYGHNGNKKLGKQISVINREAGATCPGESEFCIGCYAKHGFFAMYGIQLQYRQGIINVPKKLRPLCRIHASGDFDTVAYIRAVVKWVEENPDTIFWAYTRSWNVARLLPDLEILRARPNVQLFASVDTTMPETPLGWRVAFIQGDNRYRGMQCLVQQHTAECPDNCLGGSKHIAKKLDCKACGYCFRQGQTTGNVEFVKH